jgi:Xaa-Pro aminopeptidase
MRIAGDRWPAYAELWRARSLDAVLLTTAESIQHATGVHIYTQELIPERPVAAVLGGGGTELVVWEWEHHQIAAQAPGLTLVGFPEFGSDPWAVVAAAVERVAGRRPHVLVEALCPAAAVEVLEAAGAAVVRDAGFEGLFSLRMRKDDAEVGLLSAAAGAADRALAAEVPAVTAARTERDVAWSIFDRFARAVPGLAQGSGICAGVASNMSNHHQASGDRLGGSPVRLGIQTRVDGYWMVLTRMGWLATDPPDPDFDDDYARYIEAWQAGTEQLRPGVRAGEVYATVRDRLASLGLSIRSQKVGHGTGLTFREPPVLRADDDTELRPGLVMAYDFAIRPESTRSGRFIHVEDRFLVSESGPVRLTDATDLTRPYQLGMPAAGPTSTALEEPQS